jgi:hypothetical protein
MEQNYNRLKRFNEQILVGGFVFEYSDERWKAGGVDVHDAGRLRLPNHGFPLGYLSEEFFGLFRVTHAWPGDLDLLEARPTVDYLRELWGNGKLNAEGIRHVDCQQQQQHKPPPLAKMLPCGWKYEVFINSSRIAWR